MAWCDFPWGHVEPNESIISSVIREIKEETGLTVSNLELCGIQNWTDPTDHYRYLVFCYKTSYFSGFIQSSDEGEVFWIDRAELKNLQLADGFETMLEIFEQPQLTENFTGLKTANGRWRIVKELYNKFDNSFFYAIVSLEMMRGIAYGSYCIFPFSKSLKGLYEKGQ